VSAVLAAGLALLITGSPASAARPSQVASGLPGDCQVPTSTPPTLRYGSQGHYVAVLQCMLDRVQLYYPLTVDGDFGSQTLAAVRRFQGPVCANIALDGVVGPQTWNNLIKWFGDFRHC
jgi:peptidoglycan hydrolase-like protein with peptidoglycan-binding domain